MPQARKENPKTTHFGFQEVPESAKSGLVREVFHSVADRYDFMNDLMSFGIHRLWKRFTIAQSGVRRGHRVLDAAGGTGDLAAKLATLVGDTGRVVLADINETMLVHGRKRLADQGIVGNLDYVQTDVENFPFPDDYFDCITIGFGLRNVTHLQTALESLFRVLQPGGRLLVLEFSHPTVSTLSKAYDVYSFNVLPLLGKLVVNDVESYRYLAESIRKHPNQETLKGMMERAGFERVHYFNLSSGIVALHKGYKY